jgi:hypothetical protein
MEENTFSASEEDGSFFTSPTKHTFSSKLSGLLTPSNSSLSIEKQAEHPSRRNESTQFVSAVVSISCG